MEGALKKGVEEDQQPHGAAGWEGRRGGSAPSARGRATLNPWLPAGVLQIWGQKQRRRCLLAPVLCEKQEARTSEQSAGEEAGQGLRAGEGLP